MMAPETPDASRLAPRRALLLGALAALLAAGCALTSKSLPIVPRYFSPELPGGPVRPAKSPSSPAASELRLGHVKGASHLDERIVYRDSAYELGFYQERRWTETPDEYLKRRLSRVLFEERGLHRVVGGAAPTLEAELVAFEEIRTPKRIARVQVIVRLHDQRARPLGGDAHGRAAPDPRQQGRRRDRAGRSPRPGPEGARRPHRRSRGDRARRARRRPSEAAPALPPG